MPDVELGNCDWPDPHPPHLHFGPMGTRPDGQGGSIVTTFFKPATFACDGRIYGGDAPATFQAEHDAAADPADLDPCGDKTWHMEDE